MHLKKELYRRGRNQQILILKIEVEDGDNKIKRWHGQKDGKLQETISIVEGKNVGKSNETSAHNQAVKEATAIIVRKLKEGYASVLTEQEFSFNPLPTGFTPSKPIDSYPPGVTMSGGYETYFAQRKYNGVNLLRVVDLKGNNHTYTRGIEEISHIVTEVPEIVELNKIKIPSGTISSYEFIYEDKNGIEVPKFLRGFTTPGTTKEKAKAKYEELKASGGSFHIKVFDTLFYNKKDITKEVFPHRYLRTFTYYDVDMKYKPEEFKPLTKSDIKNGIKNKWEGFVLRKLSGPESHIEYTMNGKAYRRGAWKFKFLWTEDFFIYEFMTSSKGRLRGLPARFHLGKMSDTGQIVDCGWCGPGKLTTEDLKKLGPQLGYNNTYNLQYMTNTSVEEPLTVEIKYRSKQYQSNALEHPVVLETREDKPWIECLLVDKPQLIE